MRDSRTVRRAAVCCACVLLFLAPAGLDAVDKDKAEYIGGTRRDFPQDAWSAAGFRPDRFNAEGRIETESGMFVFNAGEKGVITIPYAAMVSVVFGRPDPFGVYDPTEQRGTRQFPKNFYSKDHYLLTIVYREASGTEQMVVLWLGNGIIQSTLATLEAQIGRSVRFADAQGCAQYRTREDCGYAAPGALRGITRVFVDTGGNIQRLDDIVSEIRKAKPDVQVVDSADGADVILNYRASRSLMGADTGLGQIFARGNRLRLVQDFAESGRSEKAVAVKFAKSFLEAYEKDN